MPDETKKVGKDSIAILIRDLNDRDEITRRKAAAVLGEVGDSSVLPALIKCLDDGAVRKTAVKAIGKIGDRSPVPLLMGLMKDGDSAMRWMTADALGNIGDKRAVPVINEALKDEDRQVRESAVNALVRIGNVDLEKVRCALQERVQASGNRKEAEKESAELYLKLTKALERKRGKIDMPGELLKKRPKAPRKMFRKRRIGHG